MNLVDLMLVGVLVAGFGGVAVLGAAEVSIIRVRRSSVVGAAQDGSRRASRLLRLLDDLPVVLNAVLLVALGLQVVTATIAGILADRLLGGVGVTIATVVLTGALFVYGEAAPKTLAMRAPRTTALRLTPVIRPVVAVARPVVGLLLRLAGPHTSGQIVPVAALSEQELRALAMESAKAGAIGEGDADLVARSFEFNDRRVGDVMVVRDDIASVGGHVAAGDALSLAVIAGHRRLPVHGADIDEILGVVRLRDLAAAFAAGANPTVSSLAHEVLRCLPDEPISLTLTRMQRSGRWLAVVSDPDGHTCGLVTIEDLVAELVGEIEDQRAPTEPSEPTGDGDRS